MQDTSKHLTNFQGSLGCALASRAPYRPICLIYGFWGPFWVVPEPPYHPDPGCANLRSNGRLSNPKICTTDGNTILIC